MFVSLFLFSRDVPATADNAMQSDLICSSSDLLTDYRIIVGKTSKMTPAPACRSWPFQGISAPASSIPPLPSTPPNASHLSRHLSASKFTAEIPAHKLDTAIQAAPTLHVPA